MYPSPHLCLIFFQFWKTILGIALVVGWLREFFLLKNLGIRFGLCNAISHPGDVQTRITSPSSFLKLLQSQMLCVQLHTGTLHQAGWWWFCEQPLDETAFQELLSSSNVARGKWTGWAFCWATQGPAKALHVCAGRNTLQFEVTWPLEELQKIYLFGMLPFCCWLQSYHLCQSRSGEALQNNSRGEKSIYSSWGCLIP